MPSQLNSATAKLLELFPRIASIVATAVGAIVLLGWAIGSSLLISVVPGLVPMNPATALAFVLLGASLMLLWRDGEARWKKLLGRACAVSALSIGLLKIVDHFLGLHLDIDTLLFREKLSQVAYAPNRMAPNTAANCALFGLALLLLGAETRRGRRPAQFLTLAAVVVSLTAISGYAFQSFAFSTGKVPIPMAVHTALTFMTLALGVLLAHPDRGIMKVITQPGLAGRTARRLLPAAILTPIALGWLRLWGQRAGLYGTEYGTTLFATTLIVILSGFVWFNARWLDRAEMARVHAQEELENFFNLSLDMMCIAGTDGYFKRVNAAWQRVLGYTAEELTSRPYTDFVHPDDLSATQRESSGLPQGVNTVAFENRYRCKNGSYRWVAWNANLVPERGIIYGAARDITDRKNDEQAIRQLQRALEDQNAQLHAANKELESFSYSVSHDLRAPLRSIDGFSQALIEDYADRLDDDGRDALKRVRAATQRMGQLIDDMLNLSRVTRGEMRHEAVDLSAMAEAVVSELRKASPDRAVEAQIEENLVARGDARLLRVVLDNLLGNAWKFTSRKPDARVEFRRDADGAFFVRDNGAGFDMAYARKLFGAFQRLHAIEDFSGTGVGLATVQRIIHRHGGLVSAEGIVGQGATFRFTVPSPTADIDIPQAA